MTGLGRIAKLLAGPRLAYEKATEALLDEALDIVNELAAGPVTGASETDGTTYCSLCGAEAISRDDHRKLIEGDESVHRTDCVWAKARQLRRRLDLLLGQR